jgi:hypothetical protein
MANFRFLFTPLSYTVTATSADSQFPATNLSVLAPIQRAWKATVATGVVDVTFDFGAGNTLSGLAANPGIFIDDANVAALRIQGNSTESWASPPWDQAVTVAKHGKVQRYKDFRTLSELDASAFAYRYLNLRIPSQASTDGANYRMARVVIADITEWTVNPGYDSTLTRVDALEDTPMLDGGFERNVLGEPRAEFTWPRTIPSAAALDEQETLEHILTPFVFWDASQGRSQDGWLVERVGEAEVRTRFLNLYHTSLRFREVI